jgi:hypothetical protein
MNYKLIKLNNGEELIGDIIENESSIVVTKPMVFISATLSDPSGIPLNVTMLKDWLDNSDNKIIEIQKSKIIVIIEPAKKTVDFYVNECNKESKLSKDMDAMSKLFTETMGDLFNEMINDSENGVNQNFEPIQEYQEEKPKKKKRKKKDLSFDRVEEPEMIYLNMMIPPEMLMNMVTSGIIDPKALDIMIKETKKRSKFTGDEKERKDFGNKFSDWNPDPSSDDYR